MKRLYFCLSWGFIIACSTAYAMDQQIASQAEQFARNARWDDLVNLIDTHPEVSGDQWLHFLTPRVTELEQKDGADGYTFCSRLLFSACQSASGDQASKKAVLEHLLSDLLGSNARLDLTRTVSNDQIEHLDIGRQARPHRQMYDRLVGHRRFPITGSVIGFAGVIVAAGVCVLAYCGYEHWKNHDFSGSDEVQKTDQQDELIITTTVPIAGV
jgi:hypothetical protein